VNIFVFMSSDVFCCLSKGQCVLSQDRAMQNVLRYRPICSSVLVRSTAISLATTTLLPLMPSLYFAIFRAISFTPRYQGYQEYYHSQSYSAYLAIQTARNETNLPYALPSEVQLCIYNYCSKIC
jgi:hypothetical protein